jgi:hypothetical protein
MPATEHIRQKLSTMPHKPGIYLMKDRFGTVSRSQNRGLQPLDWRATLCLYERG